MDADEMQRRSGSFGAVAQSYAEHRPDYPAEAVAWLTGSRPLRALELGSGTGKLTKTLTELGHDVIATDPSSAMLKHLRQLAAPARPLVARAEQIPLGSSCVDLVVSAQAFHWFDAERALPDIARVLRPGGVLGLVWNIADFKVPWVRKVMNLLALTGEELPEDPLEGSDLFTTQDRRAFRHWQRFDRSSLLGFASSHSHAAVMSDNEREELLREIGAIYDSYGRGPHGMLMPWNARCYRATVSGLVSRGSRSDSPDDGLLIDFG
jgi:SAM-dependent methyltransferase